jgi:hypothetical protein
MRYFNNNLFDDESISLETFNEALTYVKAISFQIWRIVHQPGEPLSAATGSATEIGASLL